MRARRRWPSEHSTVSSTQALSASRPQGTSPANTGATRTHGIGTGVNHVLCSQDTPEGQEQNTGLYLRKTWRVSGAHCTCTRVTDGNRSPPVRQLVSSHVCPSEGFGHLPGTMQLLGCGAGLPTQADLGRAGGSVVQNIRGSFLALSGKAGVTH